MLYQWLTSGTFPASHPDTDALEFAPHSALATLLSHPHRADACRTALADPWPPQDVLDGLRAWLLAQPEVWRRRARVAERTA